VTDCSDWRTVDGVVFAFEHEAKRGGEDAGTVEVQDVVAPPLGPRAFEKPAAQKLR
jgi:hypothetical protein